MKLNFIKTYNDINLRLLRWTKDLLGEVVSGHDLEEGQAVVYCNRAHTLWRIVTVHNGMPLLILHAVSADPVEQYGKVVAAFRDDDGLSKFVADEWDNYEKRIARCASRAQEAKEVLIGNRN